MSETPRDPGRHNDDATAHEPAGREQPARHEPAAREQAGHEQVAGDVGVGGRELAAEGDGGGAVPDSEQAAGSGADDPAGRQRRRRRLVVAGVSVAAAVIVAAICAGSLALISAFDGFSEESREARASRQLRDTACLELEDRLNRVAPPGSTANPAGRSGAIRNENAALRLYLSALEQDDAAVRRDGDDEDGDERGGRTGGSAVDGWRALLDARTSYAEALDRSAQTRTPAFFVAPRIGDGLAVADQLARRSPEACAGSIRRLAAPDL